MQEVDADKDGSVTLEEFISFFLNHYKKQQRKSRRISFRKMIASDGIKGIRKMDLMDRIMFGIKNLEIDESEVMGGQEGNLSC